MYGMHVLYYLPHVRTYVHTCTQAVYIRTVCTVGLCVCSCTCTILYLLYSKYSIYVQYSVYAVSLHIYIHKQYCIHSSELCMYVLIQWCVGSV